MINLERIEELIRYNFQNLRPYASFFEWKNPDDPNFGKKIKERGIVCKLIKSLETDAGRILFETLHYGEDPPDLVGTDPEGNLIGFEATELVDEQTIRASCRGYYKNKEWNSAELFYKLEEILRDKSQKLRTGSCARNILVIHTDEPELRMYFQEYELENSKHWFPKAPHIEEAYLLFSYFSGKKTYPYLKLNFR
jgi:hypothetical protein